MAAPPAIVIKINSSAYKNSPPESQNAISRAYKHMSSDPDYAIACLNEVLASRKAPNPLVIEAFRMWGKIALDRKLYAEACVFFENAADPRMITDPTRGSPAENQPVFEENRAMAQYLKSIIRQPRTRNIPSRPFQYEAAFHTCDIDILRTWAYGQNMPMPEIKDEDGLAKVRRTLRERFSYPLGEFLVIPPEGAVYIASPAQACPAMVVPGQTKFKFSTHCLYNEDLLERAMGNSRGWPEGHFFFIYEAIMHRQSQDVIEGNRLAPNALATSLLLSRVEIYGPVLMQMSKLLKHPRAHQSPVAVRKAPPVSFLKSADWRKMRMEYRALVQTGGFEKGLEISLSEIARKDHVESAMYHVHAQ